MILDGKKIKNEILEELNTKINKLNLSLAIIQIGDDPASNVYINQKKKMCEELNVEFKHFKHDANEDPGKVIDLIDRLNKDDTTAILLQLPIPSNFDTFGLQNLIDYKKDVDGLTAYNLGNLVGKNNLLVPCTAKGVIELLKRYKIVIEKRKAVVIGRSSLVGIPVAQLLLNENATVSICHSKTENLKEYTLNADIIVAAVGMKHLVTADMVKEGATVVDVGINKEDNKLYGDVDFENVKEKAAFISPVPGGVGPMTIAMLGQNIYEAHLLQKKLKR